MAGTKMTLHRYGGRIEDWKDQLIVVDQGYMDTHSDLKIHLDYPYEIGLDLLEVYFNGQRLSLDGGYSELDDQTIEVNLGTSEDGNPIQLEVDDEIYIKFWENHYYNRGGQNVSPTDVTNILKQIDEILNYGGATNQTMEYEYNDSGKISKETTTGDEDIVREFTYNVINEVDSETIYFKDRIIQKTYNYDFLAKRLLKTTVKVIK